MVSRGEEIGGELSFFTPRYSFLGPASLLFLEIVYYLGTNLSNFEKFVILNFDYPFGSHSVVCSTVVWTRHNRINLLDLIPCHRP